MNRLGNRFASTVGLLVINTVSLSSAFASINAALVSPGIMPAGVPTAITITSFIPDSRLIPSSVVLLRLNTLTSSWEQVGAFYDDGTHGDQKPRDSVFTIQTTLTSKDNVRLRISAAFRGLLLRQTSDLVVNTLIVPPITDAASYNSAVDQMFGAALQIRGALSRTTPLATQMQTGLALMETLVQQFSTMYRSLMGIRQYEATASNISFTSTRAIAKERQTSAQARTADIPGFIWGADEANVELQAANLTDLAKMRINLFVNHPADPQVADIAKECGITVDISEPPDPTQADESGLSSRMRSNNGSRRATSSW